jgi:hypothetical protein
MPFGAMMLDLGLGVHLVGQNAGLRAGVGDGGDPDRVQRHRGQGDGLLLADGEEHVHLALARAGRRWPWRGR